MPKGVALAKMVRMVARPRRIPKKIFMPGS